MSASKVRTIRNGDVIVTVGGHVVKDFDDARNRLKAATPKHEYVIGIAQDLDTKFNEKMAVDAHHEGQFRVLINAGYWDMAFREETLNSKKIYFVSQIDEKGSAWKCGVRRGDILHEIIG